MREVIVSPECEKFLEVSSKRVQLKFDYLLAVISEQDVVSKNFVDKLVGTDFYELRIKAENQIRIIIFTIDSQNFQEAERVILLNAFVKKSTKDYKVAIRNDKKINLPSDLAIFRYTSLKSLALAPLRLRFSTRLSKNGFIIVGKFIFSSFLKNAQKLLSKYKYDI